MKIKYLKLILILFILITLSSCKNCNNENEQISVLDEMVLSKGDELTSTLNSLTSKLNSEEFLNMNLYSTHFEDMNDYYKNELYFLFVEKYNTVMTMCYLENENSKYLPIAYEFNTKTAAVFAMTILEERFSSVSYYRKDNIIYRDYFITNLFLDDYVIEGEHCLSKDKNKYLAYFGTQKTITLPEGVLEIKPMAFNNYQKVEKIYCNQELKKIWNNAFAVNSSLKTIYLNDGIEEIGDCGFISCTNLNEIIIPYSVKSIGNRAFSGCTNLEKVVLPTSIKYMGTFLFFQCPNTLTVYIDGKNTGQLPWAQESFYIDVQNKMCKIVYLDSTE